MKLKWRRILKICLSSILLISILLALLFEWFLPYYLQNSIFPLIGKKFGIAKFAGDVRRVGLSGVDFSTLRFGDGEKQGLSVESLEVDYSPLDLLWNRKIERIIFSGVKLKVEFGENGEISIPGLQFPSKSNEKPVNAAASSKKNLPIQLGVCEFRNCSLTVSKDGKNYVLPFDAKLSSVLPNWCSITCEAVFQPRGQRITSKSQIILDERRITTVFGFKDLDLARFADFAIFGGIQAPRGTVNLKGKCVTRLDPFKLEFAKGEFALAGFGLRRGEIDIEAPLERDLAISGHFMARYGWILSEFRVPKLGLKVLPGFLKGKPSFSANAEFGIEGKGRIELASLRVIDFDAKLGLNRLLAKDSRFEMQTLGGSEFAISCEKNEWRLGTRRFTMKLPLPVPMELSFNDMKAEFSEKGLSVSAKTALNLPAIASKAFPIKTEKTVRLPALFSANFTPAGKWNVESKNDEKAKVDLDKKLSMADGELEFDTDQTKFTLKGSGDGASGNLDFEFSTRAIKFEKATLSAKLDALISRASVKFSNTDWRVATKTSLPKLNVEMGKLKFYVPEITFNSEMSSGTNQKPVFKGRTAFKRAFASFADCEIRGINAEIPISWPENGDREKGVLDIGGIFFKDLDFGKMRMEFKQSGLKLDFNGGFQGKLFSGFAANFSGDANFTPENGMSVEMKYDIPAYRIKEPFDFGKLNSVANGVTLEGEFAADGAFRMSNGQSQASLDYTFNKGVLSLPNDAGTILGLNFSGSFPDLRNLNSAPTQTMKFLSLKSGELELRDALVNWQMETAGVLLVDRARAGFCGGRIYTHFVRFAPGVKDNEMMIFADKIKIAELLRVFGVAKAEGEGTVNGKVPLKIFKDGLYFDRGFLYSTPGELGSLKLSGAELLTAGIPKSSPQFAQIEMTRQALRDFKYKWVKLFLHSKGEELLMTLTMNGKPAKPLPFKYSTEQGRYIEIKDSIAKAVIQPMVPTLNFKWPLNEIIKASNAFQNLIKIGAVE